MRLTDRLVVLLALSLALHFVLLLLLPGSGDWVEAIYARGIYPVVGPIVAFIPALLPFSLAVLLLALLIALVVAGLVYGAWSWWRGTLRLRAAAERTLAVAVVAVALVFHAFYLFWGYNYLRPPLEQRLGLAPVAEIPEQSRELARQFIVRAAEARVYVEPWDRAELDRLVDAAIADALVELEGRPPPVTSPLKGDLGSGLLARQGTRGVVSPLTLEAHVDFGLPAFVLPFTAAHEKAHLAGFARERDANFLAWYALTRSADARLRYAAQIGVIHYFLDRETRSLATPLAADLEALAAYDASHVSRGLQRASLEIYSVYLRANRTPAGTGDYARVGRLIETWIAQRGWPRQAAPIR
jgi:hypothetical protein